MKATLNGIVVAESSDDDIVIIEGNRYFPPQSILPGALSESPTPYTCPWKGVCQYYNVTTEEGTTADGAWAYLTPYPTAIERVGRDFAGYVAFSPGTTFSE